MCVSFFVDAMYFNPLPSHEGRPNGEEGNAENCHFNPLPSHEGRRDAQQDFRRV